MNYELPIKKQMNAYEFIVKLKDYASSNLQKIAQSVGVGNSKLKEMQGNMKATERSAGMLGNAMGRLKGMLLGAFAVASIFAFTNKVVDARAEYEKFNAVLVNTFQSDKVGAAALNMLTDFAAKTPYQLNDLTGSFVKLVNRGVTPTVNEMTNLGDLASSQGKGFDQLTEALLDAQTGQFERLKEFGINASKSGDKVKLSFKGVTKEVGNNKDAITNALLEYGKMDGVKGTMDVISKTLGGQISNLGDKWNSFLVAVGGQTGGIFTGVIEILSNGLAFLTESLPYITKYFQILWATVSPVINSIGQFIKSALGITTASNAMNTFKNIMLGILTVINIVMTGAMTPLGQIILKIVGAWMLWNGAVAIFNALMLVNPVTLIIIGIIALIGIIGMVTKYTSGWGESWKHTVNGAKLLWQTYTDYVKANFNTMIQVLMIGIDKIKLGWFKFKDALGIGDSSANQKMIAEINTDVEARKKSIADGYKKMAQSAKGSISEFSKVGITVDTAGMAKDFKGLKDKFSGLGEKKNGGSGAYEDYVKNQKGQSTTEGANGKGAKDKKDTIVSGGSKITHITINISKLQDDTKIFVSNVKQGITEMGDAVQEELLRAVNSVNQMQTG